MLKPDLELSKKGIHRVRGRKTNQMSVPGWGLGSHLRSATSLRSFTPSADAEEISAVQAAEAPIRVYVEIHSEKKESVVIGKRD